MTQKEAEDLFDQHWEHDCFICNAVMFCRDCIGEQANDNCVLGHDFCIEGWKLMNIILELREEDFDSVEDYIEHMSG